MHFVHILHEHRRSASKSVVLMPRPLLHHYVISAIVDLIRHSVSLFRLSTLCGRVNQLVNSCVLAM